MSRKKQPEPQTRRGARPLALLAVSVLLAGVAVFAISSPGSGVAPRHDADLLSSAKVAFVDRNYTRAEEMLKGMSGDPEARALLGRVLLELGRAKEANDVFSELVKRDSKTFEWIRGLAQSFKDLGQNEFALIYWQRAAELRGDDLVVQKELSAAQRSMAMPQNPAQVPGVPGDPSSPAGFGRPSRSGDPFSLGAPKPQAPDPTRHFPKPGGLR